MAKTIPVLSEKLYAKLMHDAQTIKSVIAMVAVGTISLNQAFKLIYRKTGLALDYGIIMNATIMYTRSLKEEFS